MVIHFVCRGNTFRSRMAEAYLKSRHLDGITVTSSGVEADKNMNGPITWEAERIMKRCRLIPFLKSHWTQTTKKMLDEADLVVFLDRSVYHDCVSRFDFRDRAHEVWNTGDIDEGAFVKDRSLRSDDRRILLSEHIFGVMVEKVDALAVKIIRQMHAPRG